MPLPTIRPPTDSAHCGTRRGFLTTHLEATRRKASSRTGYAVRAFFICRSAGVSDAVGSAIGDTSPSTSPSAGRGYRRSISSTHLPPSAPSNSQTWLRPPRSIQVLRRRQNQEQAYLFPTRRGSRSNSAEGRFLRFGFGASRLGVGVGTSGRSQPSLRQRCKTMSSASPRSTTCDGRGVQCFVPEYRAQRQN